MFSYQWNEDGYSYLQVGSYRLSLFGFPWDYRFGFMLQIERVSWCQTKDWQGWDCPETAISLIEYYGPDYPKECIQHTSYTSAWIKVVL